MLTSLKKLSRSAPPEVWGEILLDVTSLVMRSSTPMSERERVLFGEIIRLLYDRSEPKDKLRLSRKISRYAGTPAPLARHLAEEPIIIAQPVLEHCPVFSQRDLLEMAQTLEDPYLQFLARRRDLGEPVSDVLAHRGTRTVQRLLAGNRHIHLSPATLRFLVEQAVSDAVLREDLTLRPDLTPGVCKKLLPQVDKAGKQRLLAMIEGVMGKDELEALIRLRELRRKHGSKLDVPDPKALWLYAQKEDIPLDDLIQLLLQDNRLPLTTDLLAYLARMNQSDVRNGIFRGNARLIIDIAHSLDLSERTFAALARSRCQALKIPLTQAVGWIDAYRDREKDAVPRHPRRGDGSFSARRPIKPRRRRTLRASPL